MKKLISLLLCCMMLVGSLPAFAGSVETEPCTDSETVGTEPEITPVSTSNGDADLMAVCSHTHTRRTSTFSYHRCVYDKYVWTEICRSCGAIVDSGMEDVYTGRHLGPIYSEEVVIDGVPGTAKFCDSCDDLIEFNPN